MVKKTLFIFFLTVSVGYSIMIIQAGKRCSPTVAASAPTPPVGQYGVQFDWVDDDLMLPLPLSTYIGTANSAMSQEFWIQISTFFASDYGDLICARNNAWLLVIRKFGTKHIIEVILNGTSANVEVWDSRETDIQTGTWYHFAFTYGGGNVYMYLNGELDGSTTGWAKTGNVSAGTYPSFNESSKNRSGCYLCEWRIWQDVRTQAEIKANMYCVPADTTGLDLRFPFSANAIDTIQGVAPTANPGDEGNIVSGYFGTFITP